MEYRIREFKSVEEIFLRRKKTYFNAIFYAILSIFLRNYLQILTIFLRNFIRSLMISQCLG